jgi:Tfp pilus assembly protein PilX
MSPELNHQTKKLLPLGALSRNGRLSSFRPQQGGAILLAGIVILGTIFAVVTVGTQSIITMEKISSNAQQRAIANACADSSVIVAISDETAINPLINEARQLGQSTSATVADLDPCGGNTDTASASLNVNTRPTMGFSVNTLTTYNISIVANTTTSSIEGKVKQTFVRIGAAN